MAFCGFSGCVYTYDFACSNDCICTLVCFLGCCCFPGALCEREKDGSNAWITRDGNTGARTGAVMIVDHEKGTTANYSVKCCSSEYEEKPQCYFERVSRLAIIPTFRP